MKQWQKVFIACALGAFIGSIVALQLNSYLWWIGLIIGGIIGYFSYNLEEVIRAVPQAWSRATSWKLRPNMVFWRVFGKMLRYELPIAVGWSGATAVFIAPFLLIPEAQLNSPTPLLDVILCMSTIVSIISISIAATFIIAACVLTPYKLIHGGEEVFQKELDEVKGSARLFNPFLIFFWYTPKYLTLGGWYLLKGIWWLLRGIPGAAVVIASFSWHLFKLIHSDERLLCGIDAAIGVLIGYFTGNAIIGALLGGLFGVLNFEIMSKRVLKVVPMPSS